MQQLSEMDSNFLQQESARTPMHISPVIVYDQSARAGGKVRFKEILTVFERNLHKSAIFRRKLAGGAIPLEARIIAVADSFDAMIANRPYRKGLGVTEAAKELARCAGSQFDPAIVDCFRARLARLIKDPAITGP